MFNVLDKLTSVPSFWLGVYACGSAMVIATIWGVAGPIAAGSAAGFFFLAGTFGYESLTRRGIEQTIGRQVQQLAKQQQKLSDDLNTTRSDISNIKDNMSETADNLNREVYKILNHADPSARAPAQAMRVMQRSFEKMGYRDPVDAFMPRQEPANIPPKQEPPTSDLVAPARAPSTLSKTKKYKDLLLMAASRSERVQDELIEEVAPIAKAPEYSDDVIAELINHAVQNERIEIFAQPVVKLPSRKLQYLELFARIRARSGIYLTAENYRPLAEKETLIEDVDHLLLRHTIDTIRNDARHNINVGYFLNITTRSLIDKTYMAELLDFVRSRRDLASRLILELQHNDLVNLTESSRKLITGLSGIGCKFSVDNIPSSDFAPDQIADKGFSFVKFSASNLVKMCASPHGDMDVARLKSQLDKSNLTLIVEKLETEHDLRELLDFEIDFGEGYLFGRPDLEMAYRPRRLA